MAAFCMYCNGHQRPGSCQIPGEGIKGRGREGFGSCPPEALILRCHPPVKAVRRRLGFL